MAKKETRIRKKNFPLTPASPSSHAKAKGKMPPASPSPPSSHAKAKGKMSLKSAKRKMPVKSAAKGKNSPAQTHPHPHAAPDPCCHSYPDCLCGYPFYQPSCCHSYPDCLCSYPFYQPSPTSPPARRFKYAPKPPQHRLNPPATQTQPAPVAQNYPAAAAAQPHAAWDIPWEIEEVEYVLEDSTDESDDDDEENPKYPNYDGYSSSSSSSSPSTSSSQSTSSY